MIDSKYRGFYQTLLIDPLLKLKLVRRAHPSHITFAALGIGLLIPFCLAYHLAFLAFSLLALSGFLDTLDGSLARISGKMSDKGAALDITSDRLVEFAIILGLFLYAPEERGLGALLMCGSTLFCITTFLVVGIFSQGGPGEKSFYYSPGLIERAEAFALFGAMILFPSYFILLSAAFALFVALTGTIRLAQFCK